MPSKPFHRILLRLWGAPFPDWLRWLFLWWSYPKFIATVAAVIFNERGEVLLFHHTYRRVFAWGLPGGWLEGSEDPALAICREVEEESGMVIRVERPLVVTRDPERARMDIIYLARVEDGRFRPSDEVDEAAFFSPAELPVLSADSRRTILRAVQEWQAAEPSAAA